MRFEIHESTQLVGQHGAISRIETDTYIDDAENKILIITQRNGLVKWLVKYERIEENQGFSDPMRVYLAAGESTKEIMNNAIANVIAEIVNASQPSLPLNIGRGKPFPRS